MRNAKRKYKKNITLHYEYINSPESKNAIAEVFDDIFLRINKKQKKQVTTPDSSMEIILGEASNREIRY